ncbi:MAG: hypothetical protein A2V70_20970 [Planctomycetes bacterium RBG_13_63_9]|nr:MAG: hypothetical protein A2V70_20970 [Planctomycetes bacterium RBG_13_63_9]
MRHFVLQTRRILGEVCLRPGHLFGGRLHDTIEFSGPSLPGRRQDGVLEGSLIERQNAGLRCLIDVA